MHIRVVVVVALVVMVVDGDGGNLTASTYLPAFSCQRNTIAPSPVHSTEARAGGGNTGVTTPSSVPASADGAHVCV